MTAAVNTGPPMDRDEEAAHKRQLAEAYAEQAEAELAAMRQKMAGWEQAIEDKHAEVLALRGEADDLAEKAGD